jgi:hypothetical protein
MFRNIKVDLVCWLDGTGKITTYTFWRHWQCNKLLYLNILLNNSLHFISCTYIKHLEKAFTAWHTHEGIRIDRFEAFTATVSNDILPHDQALSFGWSPEETSLYKNTLKWKSITIHMQSTSQYLFRSGMHWINSHVKKNVLINPTSLASIKIM